MFNKEWDVILDEEVKKPYFKELGFFINEEYQNKIIFPIQDDIFKALKLVDYNDVLVVILGQDPYHGIGEANGLSFSVGKNVKRPPSLNNIFKELFSDTGIKRENNDLSDWCKQGVLLLNSILTVEIDNPLAHKNKGWEIFTDCIIERLNERKKPVIFVLFGNYARSKKALISDNHYVLEAVHPSPLSASRGFVGCKIFSKINEILKINGFKKIEW